MDEEVIVRDRFITLQGVRTHIAEAGSGLALLLVHGLGGPMMWQRMIEPLGRSFRVATIDLPGFGASDCPSARFSTQAYARFLADASEALEMNRPVVVGISYGGQIAAALACEFPNNVGALVLIGSTGLTSDRRLLARQPLWSIVKFVCKHIVLPTEWLTCAFSRRSFFDLTKRPGDLCRSFHQQLAEMRKREAWLNALWNVFMPDVDLDKKLTLLDVTTLIVWGNEDRLVQVRCAEEFHRLIPGSEVTVFPSCGHSLPLERAEELCSTIVSFYRRSHPERSNCYERQHIEDQRSDARVCATSRR